MKINKSTKGSDYRKDVNVRLAGGYGTYAARQDPEARLRRLVLANLLWENIAYADGVHVVDAIRTLIPQVDPQVVADIAIEARIQQKLRHVPLLLARELARNKDTRKYVGNLLPQIIKRPDEMTEFLALYWQDGKQPLAAQVKKGLATAFSQFDEYQLAKYNRKTAVKLTDVLNLVHPRPADQVQADLWGRLLNNQLKTPDTWEVALSAEGNKAVIWERLIKTNKLGALAFLRNLNNMERAKVNPAVIHQGFEQLNTRWLLPLNYLAAARAQPKWTRQIEQLMFRGLAQAPKLFGRTVLVVDVSGSMSASLSSHSSFTRYDAVAAMTVMAAEMCDDVAIYATAGDDASRTHKTAMLPPHRGFALAAAIAKAPRKLGYGGIFTRQALEYIRVNEREIPDRIIVLSDSQDCDYPNQRIPDPFGKYNYIIDISSHEHGVAYSGIWDAEITGWSEHFLTFIAGFEQQKYLSTLN